ncbi:EI24 domain-containing protein [Planktotalea arctica]|uniref:EI24 domain-containing protein n=1 Tax=Planktotalea arctica TaxID=1481893 RepID=UPI000A16DD2F|nr:EI24 domain-containing protein [Planktotalea arctica]
MILVSFFKALGQMGDPRFRRVLFLGVALTIALLAGFYALFLTIMNQSLDGGLSLPIVGEVNWLGDLLSWGSLFLMLFLSTFLMVPVASAITSLFLDEVASAVEAKHYPTLPSATPIPLYESLRDTLNFLGILIGANILAILVYIMLPFAAIFIFWALNGFLLGREYFQIAAMRRLGRAGAKQARKENFGKIWLAGCFMAVPLTVPLLNLFIPILGAATFTHLFHATQPARSSGRTSPDRVH